MKPDLIIFLSTWIFGFAAILSLMVYRSLSRTQAVSRGCICPSDYNQSAACQRCSWPQVEHPRKKVLTLTKQASGGILLEIKEPGRLTRIYPTPAPVGKKTWRDSSAGRARHVRGRGP